jgi:hypothetical protein
MTYVFPTKDQQSTYALLGMSDGCVWVIDTVKN